MTDSTAGARPVHCQGACAGHQFAFLEEASRQGSPMKRVQDRTGADAEGSVASLYLCFPARRSGTSFPGALAGAALERN